MARPTRERSYASRQAPTRTAKGPWLRWARRGSATAEMAIILPFYMILLIGVVDFCRVFYTAVAVAQAARAGTQYGLQNPTTSLTALTTGMSNAVSNVLTDYGLTGAPSPITKRFCVCPNDSVPDCPSGSAGACPPGSCTNNYNIYVCTSASYDFTTFAPYPGVPSGVLLNRIS